MSRVQMLVTTMHQIDDCKFEEMNLQTDAVIANQADFEDWQVKMHGNHKVCLVSTRTRGTSRNRNIAIANISEEAEYVVFSDDDFVWKDGYEQIIMESFKEHPECDVLKFSFNCITKRLIPMESTQGYHLATRREAAAWGVCTLTFKAELLRGEKLLFNERFGPGTPNYCGEDSIFLQELFRRGYKIGRIPVVIAETDQSESTWFQGYNEKYFTVSGMILEEVYPALCYLLALRSAWRAAKRGATVLTLGQIMKCYYTGIKKNISEKKLLKNRSASQNVTKSE